MVLSMGTLRAPLKPGSVTDSCMVEGLDGKWGTTKEHVTGIEKGRCMLMAGTDCAMAISTACEWVSTKEI
jgi:S-adenosylhomocysteine hydrolase